MATESPTPRLSRAGAIIAGSRGTLLSAGVQRLPGLPFDFRYGQPAWLDLPLDAWQRCIGRSLRGASARALDYGDPQGVLALREAIADRLARVRGVRTSAAQIVITNGSQQGIDLAARLLLDPGDVALVEEPGYDGARRALRAAGAHVIGIPVDDSGMDCTKCAPEAAAARLAHVTPAHQYPLGPVMALERRRALLDLAERSDAFVIEDDYDAEFRFDGSPLESLFTLDGARRVLHLGTFSKTLFPGLRLGYLVLPEPLVAPFARARMLADGGGSALEQHALAALIESGVFDRHVLRLRARLRERRAALLDAIERDLGDAVATEGTAVGMHLVAWLRDVPLEALRGFVQAAEQRGVGLHAITPYYEIAPPRAGVLLGYGALPPDAIREGVARIAQTLRARTS
jgi:GntR family transcriptional regulator/MocR family aminotransferase